MGGSKFAWLYCFPLLSNQLTQTIVPHLAVFSWLAKNQIEEGFIHLFRYLFRIYLLFRSMHAPSFALHFEKNTYCNVLWTPTTKSFLLKILNLKRKFFAYRLEIMICQKVLSNAQSLKVERESDRYSVCIWL